MALIVEDGTGLANAQAYCDFQYYVDFVNKMGLAYSHTREQIEPALVTSSIRWLDWQHDFAGNKIKTTQALEFPRNNNIGLPVKIKDAAAYGAWLHLNNSLLVNTIDLKTAGEIISESKAIGDLSKSVDYAEGTSQTYSRILPAELEKLIIPYIKSSVGFGRSVRVM